MISNLRVVQTLVKSADELVPDKKNDKSALTELKNELYSAEASIQNLVSPRTFAVFKGAFTVQRSANQEFTMDKIEYPCEGTIRRPMSAVQTYA